jgi:hypothetical protein
MRFALDGITFAPLPPLGVTAVELRGLPYREMLLDIFVRDLCARSLCAIFVRSTGESVAGCEIDGQPRARPFLPAGGVSAHTITLTLGEA